MSKFTHYLTELIIREPYKGSANFEPEQKSSPKADVYKYDQAIKKNSNNIPKEVSPKDKAPMTKDEEETISNVIRVMRKLNPEGMKKISIFVQKLEGLYGE